MRSVTVLLVFTLALAATAAWAQESASYRLREHVFNAAGHPAASATPGSASFRITLDALGEAAAGTGLAGASHHASAGFGNAYPPPGEARGLVFADRDTLEWDPEPSAGDYGLYRDLVSALTGLGYGDCEQQGLTGRTADDTETPPAGDGFFYLVTARNLLREEGTKGSDTSGTERANAAPCP